MDEESTLKEIARKLEDRANGNLEAAEDIWADEMIIWHSFDDREQEISGALRGAHSRAKLQAMHSSMPSFRRIVTYYVSPRTNAIVEMTTWTGTMEKGPEAAGNQGVTIGNKSVTIYTVKNGRVNRMDILDDPAASRATAELTAYGGMSKVAGNVATMAGAESTLKRGM